MTRWTFRTLIDEKAARKALVDFLIPSKLKERKRYCHDPYSRKQKLGYSADFCPVICSKASKPYMRQCLLRGQPLRGIRVRQATNKIFEVRVNILPHREWLTRLGLVEAVSNKFEDPAPRTVAKVLQERVQSVFIRKIRNLTLQDD